MTRHEEMVASPQTSRSNSDAASAIAVGKGDGKFESAHDLRRAFPTRWATRVKPVILQGLTRHRSIEATLRYYADQDADDICAELGQFQSGKLAP